MINYPLPISAYSLLRILDLIVMVSTCVLSFTLSVTIHAGIEQTCQINIKHYENVQRYVSLGVYCITKNLADRQVYRHIKNPPKLNHDIARNVCLLRCLPNFMLTPIEANPPNLIPTRSSYMIAPAHFTKASLMSETPRNHHKELEYLILSP